MSKYYANKKLGETELSGLTVEGAARMGCSVNGNPRWRVILRDTAAEQSFTVITQTDGSVSYDVDNYTRREYKGRKVTAVLSRAGRLIALRPENGV